jgi:hypothetical protein
VSPVLDGGYIVVAFADIAEAHIRRGQKKPAAGPETRCDIDHQLPIVKNVFDTFQTNSDVELPLQIFATAKTSDILDLESGEIRVTKSSPLPGHSLIAFIPAQPKRAIAHTSRTDGKCSRSATYIDQGLRS